MNRLLVPAALFLSLVSGSCIGSISSPPSELARYRARWIHTVKALCTPETDLEVASVYTIRGTSEFVVRRASGDKRATVPIEHVSTTVDSLTFALAPVCDSAGYRSPVIVAQPRLIDEVRSAGVFKRGDVVNRLAVQFIGRFTPAVVRYTLLDGRLVERSVGDGAFDAGVGVACVPEQTSASLFTRDVRPGPELTWEYMTYAEVLMIGD